MTHVWWRRWLLSAAVVSCVVAGRLGAQCTWQTVHTDPPGWSFYGSMAFDSARGRSVLFCGANHASVFEWDGAVWQKHIPPNYYQPGSSPYSSDVMAYDAARSQIVVLTGTETWVYNGISWVHIAVSGPPARMEAAMAYDSLRGRVVLFGGGGNGPALGDTWEWDGAAWAQRSASGPPARSLHCMAYDSARQRIVIFGGYSPGVGYLSDTWEWDGSNWTQALGSGPSARYQGHMAYDSVRGTVVLFGGHGILPSGSGGWLGDTWERNGAGWVLRSQSGPSSRGRGVMCFDSARGRTVLYGGEINSGIATDTWEWDGAAWMQTGPTDPSPRYHHAMVYDSDNHRALLFGGLSYEVQQSGETWSWADGHWEKIAVPGPSGRHSHAMAYDQARHQVVLFGGRAVNGSAVVSDTWILDAGVWAQRVVQGPSARMRHAMAYDPQRQRVVLFGGQADNSSSPTYFGDTWEWDGQAWMQIVAPGPSARAEHMMTYDIQRQRIVLFGGVGPNDNYSARRDTWEWDGVAWTQGGDFGEYYYQGRSDGAMAYDPVRHVTVLFGGLYGGSSTGDLWEYDGAAWTRRQNIAGPGRFGAPMVFDPVTASLVFFGGWDTDVYHGDTLELSAIVNPPIITAQPAAQVVRTGGTVSFTVAADGPGPLSYQWMRSAGYGVVDGPGGASGSYGGGGVVSGATTPTLTITGVQTSDRYDGWYYCSVSNLCTAANSQAVGLIVLPPCGTADFDGDGMIGTDADIEAFFACLGGSCCAACYAGGADFNADGDVGTDQDIDSFFRVLAGGSC